MFPCMTKTSHSYLKNCGCSGIDLAVLQFHAEQWANDNKIPIEDLEIELDQMYTPKVILA